MSLYDVAYGVGAGLTAPYWLLKPSARRKVFKALRERLGNVPPRRDDRPAVLIHAVSLGEVNATRELVRCLAEARPELRFILTASTDVGLHRAQHLYGSVPDVTVVRFPLDFSGPVKRLLEGQRPALAVLLELEVWPNFMRACARRQIPVVLVNGRLTATSYRSYLRFGLFTRPMFRRLSFTCAQEQAYADRFQRLGVAPEHLRVTGTMKFDTAQIADSVEGSAALAADVGLRPGEEPIWVCGSTGPGEEAIVLAQYQLLLARFPTLRLAIIPRHPQRFDEVAEQIRGIGYPVVRRSQPTATASTSPGQGPPTVVLGDTMGELRKFYSLADVVFVGRTLVDLGPRQSGSDMMEPAALSKPIIVGPFTGNFAEVMNRFRATDAIREVRDGATLGEAVASLLSAPNADLGDRARNVVEREQGATARHVEVILEQLDSQGALALQTARAS